MGSFRLTPKAVSDLDGIAQYTRREHGDRQCTIYIDDLEARFARLREASVLERKRDYVRPGLRCQRQGHHVIFYLRQESDVLIVRVLHERMDHEQHDFTQEG